MENLDLSHALRSAQAAAQAGRKVLLEYFGQLKKVQEKSQAGLVSEADIESERVISLELKKHFPQIPMLGEEGAHLDGSSTIQPTSWIVDPLDGTTNYVHGFHIFCISIGLQVNNELVVGLVDVPLLDKIYHAAKGRGAFVNNEPISVRKNTEVKDSLLATGFFPDDINALKNQLKVFSDLVFEARGIRRAGAAAYDLCLVGEGIFDAFWEPNLKPWDAAAGTVIVREAGGVVWNYDGQDYQMGHKTLLAGNRELCNKLSGRIQKLA